MKRNTFITAMLFAALAIQPVHAAAYHTETDVINKTGIGDISIRLDEYELDAAGNEIPYKNFKTVLPGQAIDKLVRITNQADTAWIRARLTYESKDGIRDLSDSMIRLASDNWLPLGPYYYYILPVNKNEAIDFINKLMIPCEWDESYAGKQFSVVAAAEAVQASHFTPDFTSGDPWFGTIVETCTHAPYSQLPAQQQNFSVIYEGGAEGLVRLGDDFFSNWGELMPGDSVSDTVTIRNSYYRPVSVFFRTETVADDMLLKSLQLTIANQDTILYSGTLDGAVKDKVRLAYLKQGEETVLSYTLFVPPDLNNTYARTQTKTRWIFSVQPDTSGGSSGGSGGNSDTPAFSDPSPAQPPDHTEDMPEDTPEPPLILKLAETGDRGYTRLMIFFLILSGAGGITIAWIHKKKTGSKDT